MPSRVKELRRQALLCRRAARIRTSSAALLDKILVALAEQLERDAATLEQESGGAGTGEPREALRTEETIHKIRSPV
jgi:hypothetical protein